MPDVEKTVLPFSEMTESQKIDAALDTVPPETAQVVLDEYNGHPAMTCVNCMQVAIYKALRQHPVKIEQSFDAKQVGDELHDILADSLLSCNCDDSGKCTACRIDDLAHRLSPFGPDVIAAGLEAESATVQALNHS